MVAKRTRNPGHWLAVRQLRNTAAIRKTKSDHYLNLIPKAYSNPTKFWRAVNSINRKFSPSLPTAPVFN